MMKGSHSSQPDMSSIMPPLGHPYTWTRPTAQLDPYDDAVYNLVMKGLPSLCHQGHEVADK
jgi:hypothetical protein